MKNITVAVPDDVYRSARIWAAERGTSVSSVVGQYLRQLTEPDAEWGRLVALQRRIHSQMSPFRAGDRAERDQLHDRPLR